MWLLLPLALASQPPATPPVPPSPPVSSAPPPPPDAPVPPAPPPTVPPVIDITYTSDRVITRVLPAFPNEAVTAGVRVGGCEVRFYVDEAGVPTRVVPVQCDEVFVPAAVEAGLRWRFRPWIEDGVPRKTKFNMVFVFEYQGRPPAPAP
jgi:hypothetical protein